jgi:predicted hydrocarbon binding protein
MSEMIKTTLKVKHTFDPIRNRHYLNNVTSVFHCHHYSTLYTQLAEDADFIDGKKILFDVSEENFYKVLKEYYQQNDIKEIEDQIKIAEDYWAFVGMGNLKITALGDAVGFAEMKYSHLDSGWIKKWGNSSKPVNHVTRGFLAAVWSLINDELLKSYDVIEIDSIAMGSEKSTFQIVKK